MIARIVLLGLLPITAAFALAQRRRLYAIIGMALFSLLLASVFFLVHAPDVAITEAAIGAALVTFVYVLAIRKTGRITVVASEVPSLIERSGDSIDGLEWAILERLAQRVGLDLAVEFVPLEEIEPMLLRGDADIGAGGLVLDGGHERLLRSPGHLPTIRFTVHGPGADPADEPARPLNGYWSDLVDLIRHRSLVNVQLDLARFLALSRYTLDPYTVVRHDGEHTFAFAVAPSRPDLHGHLRAIIERLRESGELDQLIGRYFE